MKSNILLLWSLLAVALFLLFSSNGRSSRSQSMSSTRRMDAVRTVRKAANSSIEPELTLEIAKQAADDEAKTLRAENNSLKNKAKENEETLKSALTLNVNRQQQISDLEKLIEGLKTKNKDLGTDNTNLVNDINDLNLAKVQWDSDQRDMAAKLEAATATIDTLEKEKTNLGERLNEEISSAKISSLEEPTNTTNRLVLATIPRSMTGEHPNRIKHIQFQLHCVAEVMRQSDFHVVVYTSDEGVAEYIHTALPLLEVSRIPAKQEREFTRNLKRTAELHPNASGYGFFNGDMCFTPGFIDATNELFRATDLGCENNHWRFVSGLRYDVQVRMPDMDTDPNFERTLQLALQWDRRPYRKGGVDFFAWNRAMYLHHILPETPEFSMPLWAADNFLFQDANCNALTLLPEHSGFHQDAILLHLNHKLENGMHPSNSTAVWKKGTEGYVDNWEERAKVDKKRWKLRQCNGSPNPPANHCTYSEGRFNCTSERTARLCS